MPRRRYARKKVSRGRRYRKGPSTKRIARIAKGAVMRAVETKEIRYAHTSIGNTDFSSIGYGTSARVGGLFGLIAQGVGQNNRIGNRVFIRGIRMYLPIAPGDNSNNLRLLVVSTKKGSYVDPTTTSFLTQVLSNGAANTPTTWTFPVDTNKFNVHLDKMYWLNYEPVDGNTGASVPRTKFLKTFIKVNKVIQWDDTGRMDQDWFLIGVSDSGAIPNPGFIGGFINVYFKDA